MWPFSLSFTFGWATDETSLNLPFQITRLPEERETQDTSPKKTARTYSVATDWRSIIDAIQQAKNSRTLHGQGIVEKELHPLYSAEVKTTTPQVPPNQWQTSPNAQSQVQNLNEQPIHSDEDLNSICTLPYPIWAQQFSFQERPIVLLFETHQ